MELTADAGAPGARANPRVLALAAGHAALTFALVSLSAADAGRVGRLNVVLGLTALMALVGLVPMHLELGRSACTFTLVEAAVVLSLLLLGPLGVVITAVAGEGIACLTHRLRPVKVIYNMAATGLAAAAAAVAFSAIGGPEAHGTAVYGCALVATVVFTLCNHTSTALVLSSTGEGRFEDMLVLSAPLAAVASAVSGSIGLALHALSTQGRVAPLLLVPLVSVVTLETRRAAAHRAEHLRFERLYAASARSTGLQGFSSALAQAAGEARALVTGATALCCAPDRDGQWLGMVVDDRGAHPAGQLAVDAALYLVEHGASGSEHARDDLPAVARAGLPAGGSVVVAGTTVSSAPTQPGGLALVVVREGGTDDQGDERAKVLWAFAFHAALIATNALLYERVEEALRHQVDLNRQKDEFLAAVSHELRTPLASMLGSVETLRRLEGRLDDDARERFFGIAQRQGKRLQRLIEELLLAAAVEHGREAVMAEPLDVPALLQTIGNEFVGRAPGRLRLRCDPDMGELWSDERKVRQVLTNLVENATKFAPEGEIAVEVRGELGGGAQFVVVDHGPGIPEADRERVFERFVQLDGSSTRSQGGTGLGLSLCRGVADLLEGELTLEETPGGGATFVLRLPHAHTAARPRWGSPLPA